MPTLTEFGQALRRFRLRAAMTQQELAVCSRLGVRTISDWERGTRLYPRAETILLVAKGLGLTPAERDELLASRRRAPRPRPGPDIEISMIMGTPTANTSLTPPRSSLPASVASIVGRRSETSTLRELLLRGESRLITLTGSPGVGKTRLALAVAESLLDAYQGRVLFVDLANVEDFAEVLPTLGLGLGVRSAGSPNWVAVINDALATAKTLLVLDNCERVLEAGNDLARLLSASPLLQVLATSREGLRVSGEREFQVQPLGLPDKRRYTSVASLADVAAIHLFVERAQAVQPEFALTPENAEAVAQICLRLDGLPLAIELATARIRVLPPRALLALLDNRLGLLTIGARDQPERHRTLRNAITWSYDWLSAEDQCLFRHLGVFQGAFDLEAVSAVVGAGTIGDMEILNGLESLAAKSLLKIVHGADEPSFAMLETLREYSVQKMDEMGETAEVRRHHASYFLRLAERYVLDVWLPDLSGSQSIMTLDRDRDNLRAALRFAACSSDPMVGFRWGAAIGWFWWYCVSSLDVLMNSASEQIDSGSPSGLRPRLQATMSSDRRRRIARGQAHFSAAYLSWRRGDYDLASDLFEEARREWTEEGDADGSDIGWSRHALDLVARWEALDAAAQSAFEEVVARSQDLAGEAARAWAIHHLGWLSFFRGDRQTATGHFGESLEIFQKTTDNRGYAAASFGLGWLDRDLGNLESAHQHFEACLSVLHETEDAEFLSHALANLALLEARRGNIDNAVRLRSASNRARIHSGQKHPAALIAFYESSGESGSPLD